MSWHVEAPIWEAYAAGRLDPAAEASVEGHVVGCAECRATARAYVAPAVTESVWTAVRTTVTAPALPLPLRWLRRAGVPEHELVLLGAADAVMLPWITAVGIALAVGLVSGLTPFRHEMAFLGLAPLVPVAAVVVAFNATESLREVSAVTPYPKLRLALLRTTLALAVAVPVTVAVGLAVPPLHSLAFVWLLPGLGLTLTALVMLTWMSAWLVGGVLSLLWITWVVGAGSAGRLTLVTGAVPQVAFAVAAAALAVVFSLRTATWTLLGGDA